MQIGDKKSCLLFVGEHEPVPRTGTVVYIHPERRFYTVRFDFEQGRSCTESYYFPHRAGGTNTSAPPRQGNKSRAYKNAVKVHSEERKRSFL